MPTASTTHSRSPEAKKSATPSPGDLRTRRIASAHWIVLALYTLLTGVMTWPLATNFSTAIPGDSFDGWQNYWNLWWMKIALVERLQSPFTTDLLYHPTGVNLYFHTLNPFNGLVTLPVQLSAGLIPAYNAVVFLSWVLGGYGMFLLALWVVRGTRDRGQEIRDQGPGTRKQGALASAFLAGLIFTFSPFHMAHLLGHMQVMSLQWMPFYVLYLLRGTDRARRGCPCLRDGLLAGLFLTLVGLCDWYFVLYLFLFTGLYWVFSTGYWIFALRRSGAPIPNPQSLISNLLSPLTAALVFLVLLSPILAPMVGEALRFSFMERPASDLYILSATLADFLIPNRLHTLFRPESFTWIGNQIAPVSERTLAIGYLPLLLTLFALWRDRRRSGFWIAAAGFFLLLALGPTFDLATLTWDDVPATDRIPLWTPYGLLNRTVPFMRISRSVSRFAVMVQLCVAVAAAVGFHALWTRRGVSLPQRSEWTIVAVVVLLAEYWVAPFPLSPPDTPAYYAQLRNQDQSGAVLNLPMNYDRPGYLLYQTVHRKPLSVAYISRDDPRTLTERIPVLQHFRHLGPDIVDVDPVIVGQTVLHDLDVGWVVLDRYKMPGGPERAYTTELAQAIFAGETPVYEDERLTVYRATPPVDPQPYLLLGPLGWGPLEANDGGELARAIGSEPALIVLRHSSMQARVRIRYRTAPGQSVRVLLPAFSQRAVATLPPAPDGGEILLSLAELARSIAPSTPITRIDALALVTSDENSAWIGSIGLE